MSDNFVFGKCEEGVLSKWLGYYYKDKNFSVVLISI